LPQAELFPNPAHDQFTLKINTKTPSQVKVEILTPLTSVQKQMIIQKPEGVPYISLSLSGFPVGQYIVRLTVSNEVKTFKLTKL
jgi:Secretion system C-terminal sorting domain